MFLHDYGLWVYALLFSIIFAETGFVVTPFLPGDSLLFVAGALAAGSGLDVQWLIPVLIAASFGGDNTNYWIGVSGVVNARHFGTVAEIGGQGAMTAAWVRWHDAGRAEPCNGLKRGIGGICWIAGIEVVVSVVGRAVIARELRVVVALEGFGELVED